MRTVGRHARAVLIVAVLSAGCGTEERDSAPPPPELAPTGILRVGIGVGAAASAFWATRAEARGEPRGVTVDLANALAEHAGVPVELVVYSNSGAITEAGPRGEWDVTFMLVDAARAEVVDFGPAYYLSDSAILVPDGSQIQSLADVNRDGVRVAAVRGTTTARSAAALFPLATFLSYDEVGVLLDDVLAGGAEAVALGRESLLSLQGDLPGSRVLDEGYNQTGVAVAVPKGNVDALAYVTAFLEDAKASGLVREALERAGLQNTTPAPPMTPP